MEVQEEPHAEQIRKCRKEECSVSQDGKCLEYESLDDCDFHYFETLPISEDEADTEEKAGDTIHTAFPLIPLRSGDDLDAQACQRITYTHDTHLVVLAGEHDTGKTTLLAGIDEAFQRGPYGGYIFAGSCTLLGFERRCFLSRLDSRRDHPDTPHTPYGDIRYLHLALREEDAEDGYHSHVLLSDISGELFREVIDSSAEIGRLDIMSRADHVAVLVDGRKLAYPNQRHKALARTELLVRAALEEGILGDHSFLDLVFAKWDLICESPDKEDIIALLDAREQRWQELWGVRRLQFHRIAVRPDHPGDIPEGYGLEPLVASWIRDSPYHDRREMPSIDIGDHDREFTRIQPSSFQRLI